MQENQFFKKMTNKGEISIRQMMGFHEPIAYEHDYILQSTEKKSLKSFITTIFWIIICSFFMAMYLKLWSTTQTINRRYFLVAAIVFGIMICVSCYRYICIDVKIRKIVNEKEYRVKNVKIHHTMPAIVSVGKTTVKVNDEKGNVYSYEFSLNRRLKRIYKNNPNADFTVIEFDRNKEMYGITYIGELENVQHLEQQTYSADISQTI